MMMFTPIPPLCATNSVCLLKRCWSDVPVKPMAAASVQAGGGVFKPPPERVRCRLSV